MPVPAIQAARLDLVSMSPDFIEALLDGRRAEAEALGHLKLPKSWPDEHDARFLRLRLGQMREDPSVQPWFIRAMVLRESERPLIGHIGFHGRPGENGSAEMGYTVLPEHRRRGYAAEAAQALMAWAAREHGAGRFIVSISPDNAPSLGMAAKLGFRQIGEQMDEEDGLELVFELVRA